MTAVINLHGVGFTYPGATEAALQEISLQATAGSFTVILGAEGSGRTTLARLIAGLLHTGHGNLRGRIDRGGQRIAVVGASPETQLTGLCRTVAEELVFGLENQGIERAELRRRVGELASALGLGTLLAADPMALSGGQRNLVAIAAGALSADSVLVLDEPYASLDHQATARVSGMLHRLRELGWAIVVTDARTRSCLAAADHVVVLQRGRIFCQGQPEEVFADPRLREAGVHPTRTWAVARQLFGARSRLPWRSEDLAQELA